MTPTANIENENPFTLLPIDEEEMTLETSGVQGGYKNQKIHATSKFSNDAWFDRMGIDKAIAKAIKNGYNRKFIIFNYNNYFDHLFSFLL